MQENHEDLEKKTRGLVARAREGDSEAVNELYLLYEDRLKGAARNTLGGKLRAKMETVDLIQSVWKDCLSDMEGFEYRGPDSFVHWLLRRITRKAQNKGRFFSAKKRDVERENRVAGKDSTSKGVQLPPASDPTPSAVIIRNESLERLMRLLDHLPDSQRLVLVLRMRDKMDFEQIAKTMNRSPDAARKLYNRALNRIQDLEQKSLTDKAKRKSPPERE
jgi:RNA polymerase sigma-70 factor, ECF subfamily